MGDGELGRGKGGHAVSLPRKRHSSRSRLRALMTCASMPSANCISLLVHRALFTHGHAQVFVHQPLLYSSDPPVSCPHPIAMALWRFESHINSPGRTRYHQHTLYLSLSLSHSFITHLFSPTTHEYLHKEQVEAPRCPRHDPRTARRSRHLQTSV